MFGAAAILKLGTLNKVGNLHSRRTGQLTSFAIEAVFEGIIVECRVFQTIAFLIGSGFFGTRIEGVHLHHRTDGVADRALKTSLKI
jgi:hypothetical protein